MGKVIQFPSNRGREEKPVEDTCTDDELDKEYKDYYSNYCIDTSISEYIEGLDYAITQDGRIVNLW